MTTNEYFDQEMRVLSPDKALLPRSFALCWDTPDLDERRRRDQKLYHLAVDPLGSGGFALDAERFKAAWTACRAAWKEDPTAFLEQNLESGSWFSAACLMAQTLPELYYVVEGFLPQGLVVLASPPKYGKSWLALQLCLAVSQGEPFLGMPCHPSTCLYLALEDGKQRLQKRLARLDDQQLQNRSLYFETRAITLGEGLLLYLEGFVSQHPDCRLVVIDTLQKVRGSGENSSSLYASDYTDMGHLKAFADRFGLCLVLVHHLRKMSDETDPFNRIAGSNGIFGAADAALVLTRAKREDPRTILDLAGRDVEEQRLVLRFDKASCRWHSLGAPDEAEEAVLAADYANDPLVKTILQQLEAGGGKWQTNAKGFLDACKAACGSCPVDTGQTLARRLDRLAPLLHARDGVLYQARLRGTAGRNYSFRKPDYAPAPGE